MNRLLLLSLGSVFAALPARADIRGRISDAGGKGIPGLTVLLSDSSGTQVLRTALSDEKGQFRLSWSTPGDYQLRLAPVPAYQTEEPVLLHYEKDLELPEWVLTAADQQLREVTISTQKPLIEMKSGKVIMNVGQSISAAGATAMDMLQRAPGVSVDNNDNIALKGRQGVTVMMDGKRMVLSGTELANLLKSMPAAAIDQIELMSNPDARYDAAGTAGIINIKTRKEKRQGYNGSVQLGAGQGVYPKSNTGVNLNYRTPKLNLFLNASGAWRKGFNELDMHRMFLSNGRYNGHYKQDNYAVNRMQYGNINAGADYTINAKTVAGITLSGGGAAYTFEGNNRGQVFDSLGQYRAYFLSRNKQESSNRNYGINTNIRHDFDSAGRTWSFDADYARYSLDNRQRQGTDYYLPDNSFERPYYLLEGDMKGFTRIYALKTDYTQPLSGNRKIEGGLKSSFVTSDNQPDFYDASSGTRVFDSSKSNHFIYNETILAAYANFSKDWKKWSLQTGLRYEHTLATGDQRNDGQNFRRDYGQLFPNINLSYTRSERHQFNLSLSRRIDRPNYEQLNPFKNYIDPTSIHQGNPYLNPSFSYTAELSHTFKSRFTTAIGLTHTKDVITQVIILDEQDQKITLVTDRNLATNNTYSLSGNYPVSVGRWWQSVNGISCYYSLYKGNLSNTALRDGIPTLFLNTNNTFILPGNWSAELNAWYASDQRYGYMYLRPMFAINAGIQKTCWNKAATIRVSVTDVFRRQNPVGITEFSNYRESFVVTRDTRTVQLSLSYRFGNSKWQRAKRAGGADEERRRAGTASQAG